MAAERQPTGSLVLLQFSSIWFKVVFANMECPALTEEWQPMGSLVLYSKGESFAWWIPAFEGMTAV